MRQYKAQSSDTIKAAILAHNPRGPEWWRHVGLNATRLHGYYALKSEQWGIEDRNDTTPMEVGALMKGKGNEKGKGKGNEKGKEKGRAKSKDKPRNIRHVEHEVFLLQG